MQRLATDQTATHMSGPLQRRDAEQGELNCEVVSGVTNVRETISGTHKLPIFVKTNDGLLAMHSRTRRKSK
jgi:hypothetical protein